MTITSTDMSSSGDVTLAFSQANGVATIKTNVVIENTNAFGTAVASNFAADNLINNGDIVAYGFGVIFARSDSSIYNGPNGSIYGGSIGLEMGDINQYLSNSGYISSRGIGVFFLATQA